MSGAEQSPKPISCPPGGWADGRQWFTSALGVRLQQEEAAVLGPMLGSLIGPRLLTLGLPLAASALGTCEVAQKINCVVPELADPAALPRRGHCIGDPCQLPLPAELVDGVLLNHALDFSDRPHPVLREAARVLAPGGKLLITGFNPWSLWGARRLLTLDRRAAPWACTFINPLRLLDWLTLLDFRLEKIRYVMYRPPFNEGRLRWLDRPRVQGLKRTLNVPFGAVYVVHASKQAVPMTPRRAWSSVSRPQLAPVAEHAARVARLAAPPQPQQEVA